MKNDKAFYWRMEGAITALSKVKEQGYDTTLKEIRQRNVLKADFSMKKSYYDSWWDETSKNLYTNMFTCVCYTLNRCFRFGPKKLAEFKKNFDDEVKKCLDLDYLGEHYVTMTDYAKELNQKYNMEIDIKRISESETKTDETIPAFHDSRLYDGIANMLQLNGYEEAAEFMRKRKESNLNLDEIKYSA